MQDQTRVHHILSSAWKDVKKGCPQGSSFGPLLWNIFQNDLYAVDHHLYVADKTPKNVESALNADVELATTW